MSIAVSRPLLALALALMSAAVAAPPAAASCYRLKPPALWRQSKLVFVGTVLPEGGTEVSIPDADRPDHISGKVVTVQVAIDRVEKGRPPRNHRITLRQETDYRLMELTGGCSGQTFAAGQRARFYVTPDPEHPGQYVGAAADLGRPAR